MAYDISSLFRPRSVAVIGVSRGTSTKRERFGKGVGLLSIIRKVGFQGRIYPIHPKMEEVLGFKAYPSLRDVPDVIDLVIISVSSHHALIALEQCVDAGIKNVHLFTAGFSETGEKAGKILQEKIAEVARKGGINLVGPNCVGLHLPYEKFSTVSTFMDEGGEVAFLSQSGGHTLNFIGNAHFCGIGLSKAVSFGNAAVLDSPDFIEYLGQDPKTSIIAIYVEGINDGRRFFEVVKKVNRLKPVIFWKGGTTDGGARAAASHTGSLGGRNEIWNAFFKQTGVMTVDSMKELLDLIRTVLYLKPTYGRKLGLVIGGGGQSVAAADFVVREGLELPSFSDKRQNAILDIITRVNTSAKNPVDIGTSGFDPMIYDKVISVMATDPSIDLLLVDPQFEFVRESNPQHFSRVVDILCDSAKVKPLGVILDSWEGNLLTSEKILRLQKKLSQSGVVSYCDLARACRAIAKFINYHNWLLDSNCHGA